MKLPKKINIMSVDYDIVYVDSVYEVNPHITDACYHYINLWENKIVIFKGDRDFVDIWYSIISRVIFWIFYNLKFKFSEEDSKQIDVYIENISRILNDILFRNFLNFNNIDAVNKINIFSVNYKVLYFEKAYQVCPASDELIFGHIDPSTCCIRLFQGNRKYQDVWQILWHEILHAILDKLHITLNEDDPEEDNIIDVIAIHFNDFLFRNKLNFKDI